MTVARFNLVGIVKNIHDSHSNAKGMESVALTLDVGGEIFHVILSGKLLTLLKEDQIRLGDQVYVEGKLRRDRALSADVPKLVCVLFVSFLSVI